MKATPISRVIRRISEKPHVIPRYHTSENDGSARGGHPADAAEARLQAVCKGSRRLMQLELAWLQDGVNFLGRSSIRSKFGIGIMNQRADDMERATHMHPLLDHLVGPCGGLAAAQRELAWIKEHVEQKDPHGYVGPQGLDHVEARLKLMCEKRREGMPLQYLLGSAWFGGLKLLCEEGVLIPREDTATQVTHLVQRLHTNSAKFKRAPRVLDLCSGSGCMSLLFAHSMPCIEHLGQSDPKSQLEFLGVDLSTTALSNAMRNTEHLLKRLQETEPSHAAIPVLQRMRYMRADVLNDSADRQDKEIPSLASVLGDQSWDIVLCNPPYISRQHIARIPRSVRRYEPISALAPPPGMVYTAFYRRVLQIAREQRAKVVLMEVGNFKQAKEIMAMVQAEKWFDGIEVWRDEPNAAVAGTNKLPRDVSPWDIPTLDLPLRDIKVVGAGQARAVVCWHGEGAEWLSPGAEADQDGMGRQKYLRMSQIFQSRLESKRNTKGESSTELSSLIEFLTVLEKEAALAGEGFFEVQGPRSEDTKNPKVVPEMGTEVEPEMEPEEFI